MKNTQSNVKRILYADAPASDTGNISSFLDAAQYKVSVAKSGKDAIEQIQKDHFDLVLMHFDMMDMNGAETARTIRQDLHKDPDSLPIIALVPDDTPEKRRAGLEAGIDDFLEGPIEEKTLLEKVKYWIEGTGVDSFQAALKEMNQPIDTFPILDQGQIDMFTDFIGFERTQEIIKEFKDYYGKKIDVIFDAAASAEDTAGELHAMASISGNIGRARFSMSCRSLMNDLKEKDVSDRMERLMEIQDLYNASIEKLDEILHSMGDDS